MIALLARLRRTPPPAYAGFGAPPPPPVVPPVVRGLLVQDWRECGEHGPQLVSVLEPGCGCP